MTFRRLAQKSHPARRFTVLVGAACLLCQAAWAEPNHPALRSLLPLEEVFAAGKATPTYDVAGLRCAGLFLAQSEWSGKSPDIKGPGAARMGSIDHLLIASEQQRLNDGMDLVQAHVSIERETRRIWRLYRQRFAANARKQRHPWAEDRAILGDFRFCDVLIRGL